MSKFRSKEGPRYNANGQLVRLADVPIGTKVAVYLRSYRHTTGYRRGFEVMEVRRKIETPQRNNTMIEVEGRLPGLPGPRQDRTITQLGGGTAVRIVRLPSDEKK